MRHIVLALLLVLGTPATIFGSARDAVMPLFTFGETGASLGTCFAVGNGRYLVTTADNVMENLGPSTKRSMKRAIAVSPWTGDIHQARVEKVDEPGNLALLRLEKGSLPAIPFERSPRELPYVTLGQLIDDPQAIGGKWPSLMYSYRAEKSAERTSYVLKEWRGKNAFLTESKGRRWLFLKDVEPTDKAPGGGPVLTDGGGVVGVYVSRFLVESGSKSYEQRLCVPLTETVKFLEGAGLKKEELYDPPKTEGTRAETTEESFQSAWRAVSNVAGANWAGAVVDAKAFTQFRPKSSQAWLLYGVALAGAGKHEEAVKQYDAAIHLDKSLAGAYLNRGIAYGMLNKKKEAEQDLRKAGEFDSEDVQSRMWLSRLLAADESRRDEAIKVAEDAVKLAPESPVAFLNLASALALNKQHERAAVELKRALEIAPDFQDARAALAANFKVSGRLEEAEQEYRALVKTEPENPATLLELAAFLIEEGKRDEGKQLIDKVLDLNPDEKLKKAAEELKKEVE